MTDQTPPTTPSTDPESRPRRFKRSGDDKMVAGVAGGLGRYFGVDPTLVRIAFAVLALFGGSGFALYLLAWVFTPGEPGAPSNRVLLRVTLGIVAVAVATAVLLFAGFLLGGFGGDAATAIGVAAAGLALVGAAFAGWRRARWLIAPALALAFGAAVPAAAGVDLTGGWKEGWVRFDRADIAAGAEHHWGAGDVTVDLRRLDLPAGDTRVRLNLGTGRLRVLVPRDACVASDSSLGAGAFRWFGDGRGGPDLDLHADPVVAGPRLVVAAHVGLGDLEIERDPRHFASDETYDDFGAGPLSEPAGCPAVSADAAR